MTHAPRRRRVLTALPIAAALLLAACGGGDDSDATTTTTAAPAPTTSAAPRTTASTSTTAASTTTSPATTEPATTTTAAPAPTFPLTGLPMTEGDLAALRRALVVKIDNNPAAVPQSGLGAADIVYEENVEGWTRFAMVLHSQTPEPVGPIRSGRTQDIMLLESLNHPLFLWSGGNANVTAAINGSELVNLSPSTANGPAGFYREGSRQAPHNLYASSAKAWEAAPEGLSPPPPQFTYAAAGTVPAGLPVAAADLSMEGGLDVRWEYDAASGRFFRSQRGSPHNGDDGNQLNTENLVVVYVEYQPSPADRRSPEAQTTGTGEAFVMRDGVVTHGTWARADSHSPWTFTDESGAPIALNPGNTWVELAKQDALTLS
jgi:hypothetical protein